MSRIRDWLFQRGRKSGAHALGVVAVMRRPEGVGLAHVRFDAGHERPVLHRCLFHPVEDRDAHQRVISRLVRRCGVEKARFVGVLERADYSLFPADAPALPRDEWGMNMRWKIGDRIDYPVEEAVVELFDLPGRVVEEPSGKVYVAVARDADVQKHVDWFLDAGLNLVAIDILELALGRLTDRLPEDQGGVALLHWEGTAGVVMVRRHGRLFLARTIEVSAPSLEPSWVMSDAPGGLSESESESEKSERASRLTALTRALRRTFDFYESTFHQSPLEALFITPSSIQAFDGLSGAGVSRGVTCVAGLADALGMRVQVLPLEQVVVCAPDVQQDDLAHCLPAVGAALAWAPVG